MDVGVLRLRLAQHREERRDALREARRHFVVRMIGLVFMEVARMLGPRLLRLTHRVFELRNRAVELVGRDHPTLAELLADEAEHVDREILQHIQILCRLAFERNHDNSLFILLCSPYALDGRPAGALNKRRGRLAPERHISTC
ncbi:hypothetical protein DM56_4455 [Burkholderia mallei]|nr:hypothetical protein DM75_3332 [Burkholderia mallei]KOS76048.1 hypothetical protein DM46_1935 [Burkholderia mallei]KOS81958.1 hypothetical protein DO61_4918 [Burkholderia mallei]KOS93081.1 hypothetical protein DM45_3084 [Burkholderia mallei]KOS96921.1 hypothetical protein DM49_3043 [Burkholderia mallei]